MTEAPDLMKLSEDAYNEFVERIKKSCPGQKVEELEDWKRWRTLGYMAGANNSIKLTIGIIEENKHLLPQTDCNAQET